MNWPVQIIWILLGCSSAAALAEDHDVTGRTFGVGWNSSCKSWVGHRVGKDIDEGTMRVIEQSWVEGYLSAFNVFGWHEYEVTKGVDIGKLLGWIDVYCGDHPSAKLKQAVENPIWSFEYHEGAPLLPPSGGRGASSK